MFKGRIQMRAKLVRMLLVVSLLTMGLLVVTPTPVLACHGTITIVKETDPDGGTGFNFSGDLGSFTLNDNGSKPFYYTSAGWYNVTESVPSGWDLDSIVCTGGNYENIANGVKIHLEIEGQQITCTFTNKEHSVTIEKTSAGSDNPLKPGSTITYTIVVSNPASSGSQTNIAINDPLPTGTSYVPGSSKVTVSTIVLHGTVRDEFNTRSYGNNNGTMSWSGDWQEIGETKDAGPLAGEVQVSTETNKRLRIGAQDYIGGHPGAWRMADLSGATSATFSFDYQAVTNASDDWLAVQVSRDGGGSWDTLETFKGSSSGSRSYDISFYASSNTAVRFQVTDHYGGSSDFFYADNVQIEFWKRETTTAPGGDPPNLVAGYSLLPGESMTVTFQAMVNNPIPEGLTQIVNTACATSDQVSDPICDTTTDRIRTCCTGATSITFKNVSSGYIELWFYEGTHVNHPNAPYDPTYFAHFNNIPPQGTITLNASVYFASGYFPEYIYNYGSGCHWGWDIQLICDDPESLAVGDRNPDYGWGQKVEAVQVIWEGDCPCSLGDYVWIDTNANGIQDVGESGLDGVTVNLYDGSGNQKGTTSTSGGGYYIFDNLDAGDYYVEFVLPDGYAFTLQDEGSDNTVDSDADTVTGMTVVTHLDPWETDLTWDAGLYQPASIGDYVWVDTNANGIQDTGESGLDGVTVNLYDGSGNQKGTTSTSGGGYYLFTNLTPGDYYVEFVAPSGYVFTTQDAGDDALDSDANPTNGKTIVTTLVSGETDLTWDAGLYEHECQPGDMDGAATLVRTGDTVSWDITNNSGRPLIIQMIELNWPSSNGKLQTVKLDGVIIFDQGRDPTYTMIDSGWTGTLADRTIEASAGGSGTGTLRTLAAGSGTETLELVFENTAVAGSEFEPYSILVQCVGAGCVDDITEGEPTVITLSSFTAKPSAGGPASPLWLGLAGLTVLVGGSFVWTKRRAG